MDSWELSSKVIVASSRSLPSFKWSMVEIVKPLELPRIRRDCWRVSRDERWQRMKRTTHRVHSGEKWCERWAIMREWCCLAVVVTGARHRDK